MSLDPSHPKLKFATLALLGFLAEAFDGGENFVGGFDPPARFGVFVMRRDEGGDVGLQFGGSAVDTPLQLLAGKLGEPAFHLIDPARRGRREMHMPMRAAGEPGLDLRRLVGGVQWENSPPDCFLIRFTVHHQRHVRPVGQPAVEFLEEVEKPGRPMPFAAFADHRPVAISSAANSAVVPWRMQVCVLRSATPGAIGNTG